MPAGRGFSLVELSVVMIIMVIIGLAVTNLVKSGLDAQMSQRTQELMMTIANNVADDLRYDIRTSQGVSGGANTLTVKLSSGSDAVYAFAGTDLTRTVGANVKRYNKTGPTGTTNYTPAITLTCASGCFQINATGTAKTVVLNELIVHSGSTSAVMNKNFSGAPTFRLKGLIFSPSSTKEFQ